MHLTVLACDLDGTLAEHDRVAPETWQALRQAKAAGLTIILVTGRRLDTFTANSSFAELCEAIVAENGAVVYFPRRDMVALPFGHLATSLWQRLKNIDPFLLKGLDHWLITRLTLPEEIETITPFLTEHLTGSELVDRLPNLPLGQAYLSFNDARWSLTPKKEVISFRSGPRTVPHIRHLHKYLMAPLPEAKRFFFHDPNNASFEQTAASLWEFREALEKVPQKSLQYHLQREDFERWLKKTLHDEELTRRISKIRRRNLSNSALRQALLEVVTDRYEELDNLL